MKLYVVNYFSADHAYALLGIYTNYDYARNCILHYVKEDEETIVHTTVGIDLDWYELEDGGYYEISTEILDEDIYDRNGEEVEE